MSLIQILHYFDNLSPGEVILHLMPLILQASISRIQEEEGFNILY